MHLISSTVDGKVNLLSMWADKKETCCHDETDPIKQTGGSDFVKESWGRGHFLISKKCLVVPISVS